MEASAKEEHLSTPLNRFRATADKPGNETYIKMKKIIALLIGCSLGLATAGVAQQPPEGQESTAAKKGGRGEKTTQQAQGATETKANAAGQTRGKGRASAPQMNATQPTT